MLVRRLLYSFVLCVSLASCTQRDHLALSMGAQSINNFNSGHPGAAEKLARRLWWLNRDESRLLVGQYAIYKAIANEDDLSQNMGDYYRDILGISMDIKNKDFYFWLIVANVFSDRYSNGIEHAKGLFKSECQEHLELNSNQCIYFMATFHERRYESTHDPYDALYAYEAAVIARDLGTKDSKITNWLIAYPMITINNAAAGRVLAAMDSRGELTPKMKSEYCKFVKDDLRFRMALDCFKP
jgi:hypothetical protein